MKFTRILIGCSAVLLAACAGSQQAASRSISEASATKAFAEESSIAKEKTVSAEAFLDSARSYEGQSKFDDAAIAGNRSSLEYRLALLTAEQDSLKRQDEKLEGDLRADVERKLLYQNILDKESKEAK